MLGICLGQQVIAECFGGNVVLGERPMHGKFLSFVIIVKEFFKGLPQNLKVARYHSLIVDKLPNDFEIDAQSEDGVIQAIHQPKLKLWALQFQPKKV